MHSNRLHRALALPLLLGLGACSLTPGRSQSRFLRAGPLGPENGGVVRSSVFIPAAQYTVQGAARLPAAFSPTLGRKPLPGATLAGISAVNALVVPISLGEHIPALNEDVLLAQYFGAHGQANGTLAQALDRESDGAFRFSAQVLPMLVNPQARFSTRAPTSREIESLAREVLTSWGRETDLRAFDNSGIDGVAGSPDDDGAIDLLFLVVETAHGFQPFTLAEGFTLSTGGSRVRTGPVHVIPAAGGTLPDLRVPLDQVLASLGLAPAERFFPTGYPRTISSVGRARLGWLGVQPTQMGGSYALESGNAMVVPLSDLAADAGFWLVERSRERVYTSRVALRPDGHYQVTDSVHWTRGEEQPLPLSYQMGMRGPLAMVSWASGASAPSIRVGGGTATARPALPPTWTEPGQSVQGGGYLSARNVRPAADPNVGTRWVRLGTDSVRVAIAGEPLALP